MARFTYLGSFDDKVAQYHRYNEAPIKTLNEILVSELIFANNSTILLNDGYIVQSPIIQQALLKVGKAKTKEEIDYYTNSPLFHLIKRNHVQVLSRQNNLVEMIRKMANDGIESYEDIVKIDGWEEKFGDLDSQLEGKFISWPPYEMGEGFVNLINGISAQSDVLKRHVDSDIFQRMRDDFSKKLNGSNTGTRDIWEKVAKKNYPNHLTNLMRIANRVYHYNFGLCLQAQPYKDHDVFVNSISSDLFADRAVEEKDAEVDLRRVSFKIPRRIKFDEDFIDALGEKGELSAYRNIFMEVTNKYLSGQDTGELSDIQNTFRGLIEDFDHNNNYAERDERVGLYIEIAMEVISTLAGDEPTISLVTQVIGEIAPGGVSAIRRKIRYSGQQLDLAPRSYTNKIESVQISGDKAAEHAGNLTFFKKT